MIYDRFIYLVYNVMVTGLVSVDALPNYLAIIIILRFSFQTVLIISHHKFIFIN